MQKQCVRFIVFYKFSQIKRNDNRQPSPLSHVPRNTGLSICITEVIFDSFQITFMAELKFDIIKI